MSNEYRNKYFDDIGYKKSAYEQILYSNKKDKRESRWTEERAIQGGFDERCSWALNTFIAESIFTWLNIYKDNTCADLNYHKFTISINPDDTPITKTEGEWIDDILEYLKEYLLTEDTCDMKKEEYGRQCAKKAFIILSEIFPALWW